MEADTLPEWLHNRFGDRVYLWGELEEADKSYWEHEAEAVRRATARDGFKRPSAGYDPDTEDRAAFLFDIERVVELLKTKQKISAIKYARTILASEVRYSKCGLKEAKDACDLLEKWLLLGYAPPIIESITPEDEQGAIRSIQEAARRKS